MQKHSYVASIWYYVRLTACFNDIRFTFDCRKQVNINPGSEPGEWAIVLHKNHKSNVIHRDFVYFRKKHSRHKADLPSIVYSSIL